MTPLPSFERSEAAPPLPAAGSAIAIAKNSDGLMSQVLVHGHYRVSAEDRARLGPHAIRHQVSLVAIRRNSRESFVCRPGEGSVVFSEEEPEKGAIEGWFHVQLAQALALPKDAAGPFHVTAVLGPFLSRPIEVMLRSG